MNKRELKINSKQNDTFDFELKLKEVSRYGKSKSVKNLLKLYEYIVVARICLL